MTLSNDSAKGLRFLVPSLIPDLVLALQGPLGHLHHDVLGTGTSVLVRKTLMPNGHLYDHLEGGSSQVVGKENPFSLSCGVAV